MAYRPNARRSQSHPQTIQTVSLPAPSEGINSQGPISSQSPLNCLSCINIVPSEYGLRTRKGYSEWAISVPGASGIQTIIPFEGQDPTGAGNRLFAVTNEGIFDVTARVDTPVAVVDFVDQSVDAGYGVFTNFTSDAKVSYVFYADSKNGLWAYDESSETWAQPAITGDGISVDDVRFVALHNQRIWIIGEGSSIGYYLPVGSIAGEVAPFHFGSNFAKGGELVGLWRWSRDGGAGVDDYLIGVSRGGDVLAYAGTDPTDVTTWSILGTYSIGAIPAGNRIAYSHGGSLSLLSTSGLVEMGDLLRGLSWDDNRGISAAISQNIVSEMEKSRNVRGWEVSYASAESQLVINFPQGTNPNRDQFVYSQIPRGWGVWRGMPMDTLTTWAGDTFFADSGVVYLYDGDFDNTKYDGTLGVAIPFAMLSSYNALGNVGIEKHGQFVRVHVKSKQRPVISATALYDYDTDPATVVLGPVTYTGSVWGSAIWSESSWGSSIPLAHNDLLPITGIGSTVAISIVGKTKSRAALTGWDIMWCVGGPI